MKLNSITACVFDAYGTLFDVNSAAAKWNAGSFKRFSEK
jgi:FMN phosphatase YigB (HAD superfamily)